MKNNKNDSYSFSHDCMIDQFDTQHLGKPFHKVSFFKL